MNGAHFRIDEVQDAVDRYLSIREEIEAGGGHWESLAEVFTDDAVYVDPAWGRVEGRDGLIEMFRTSMTGLEDWSFPVDSVAISGDRVFIRWIQRLPGRRPDGTRFEQSGVSMLVYAGGGRFRFCEDLLNMVHVLDDLAESGWRPGPGFVPPPSHPIRDASIPEG